jgi:peptidoglycan/LPS O-acetylase OafA/YrhL
VDQSVSKTKNVYRSLEAWRGLAAIWVLLLHAGFTQVRDNGSLLSLPIYWFFEWGHLGVEMFFVISGYCIAAAMSNCIERGQSARAFVAARVRRIYPPYWFALGIMLVGAGFMTLLMRYQVVPRSTISNTFEGDFAQRLFYNFFLVHTWLDKPPIMINAWTLSYEVAFYLICAAFIGLFARVGMTRILTMLHVVTALTVLVPVLGVNSGSVPFPFARWCYFGMGLLVYDLLRPREEKEAAAVVVPRLFLSLILLLVGVHAVTRLPEWYATAGSHGVELQAGTLFMLVLLFLHRWDSALASSAPVRALSFVGTFSYSLYLQHFTMVGLVSVIGHRLHLPVAVEFLAMVGASLVAGWLTFIAVERHFMGGKRNVARMAGVPVPTDGAGGGEHSAPAPTPPIVDVRKFEATT